jgi:hypothetical protein
MRNLGPKSRQRLADIGIQSIEDLHRHGVVTTYTLLRELFPESTIQYALGLAGRPYGHSLAGSASRLQRAAAGGARAAGCTTVYPSL